MEYEYEMTITNIMKKLIGLIDPVGKTEIDDERYVNLKVMCEVINNLITEIESVAYVNKDRPEASRRRAGECADEFLRIIGEQNE